MTVLHTIAEVGAEIETRLLTLTVAQGAETNMATRFYRGRRVVSDDLVPCTVLIEAEDTPSDQRAPLTTIETTQRYAVLAYVPCDPANPNDAAHAAIRDIKRAIWRTANKPDVRLGGFVRRVKYAGKDIGPRADGEAFVVAVVEFDVEFAEDLANP